MKCYFDNLDRYTPNIHDHSGEATGKGWWLIPNGTNLKQELILAGAELDLISNITTQGCYFLDVNGDPVWWAGYEETGRHALEFLSEYVIEQVKNFKLRIIITADREGGPMIHQNRDCFRSTTDSMKKLGLPPKSVLITQGNKKIKEQYKDWLKKSNSEEMFEVMYINHFSHIFFDQNLPGSPIIYESIKNNQAYDYNSLNRVYRDHRASHLYYIVKNNILDKGLVSANQIKPNNFRPLELLGIHPDNMLYGIDYKKVKEFDNVMLNYYPKFIDGDWSSNNAANQYNTDIYKNSLISFITETQYDVDVVFLTEKIFKPIALGHPMIVLASAGTMKGLSELGFKTNYLGIDPSYNDIVDDTERLLATNKILKDWVELSPEEKKYRIYQSFEAIDYNFNLIRSKNFYTEALSDVLNKTRDYFLNGF